VYRNLSLRLLLISLAVSVGCTRKAGTTANITLSIGAQQAKDTSSGSSYPQVIILNVTGPGIATPIFYQWSAHNNSSTVQTPPDSITLTVPTGSSRLIQGLVVMGSDSGAGQFLYDSTTVDISSSTPPPVTLSPQPLGSGTGQVNDQISCRYLSAAGVGPTGTITASFVPPGQPAMVVDQSQEMINGWFRVFALEGAQIMYTVSDGTVLFGGGVSADMAGLIGAAGDSPRTIRVYNPVYYQKNGNSGSTYQAETASRRVMGWFGPGALGSGKRMCYNSQTETISNSYLTSTGTGNLQWTGNIPSATSAFVENVTGTAGGVGVTSIDPNGFCTATGTRFVDYLSFSDQLLQSNDQNMGFLGPFQLQMGGNGGGSPILTSLEGSALSVNWTFLPGVQSTATLKVIDGVEIFARIETATSVASMQSNGYDFADNNGNALCSKLSGLPSPFTSLMSQPSNSDASVLPVTATTSVGNNFSDAFNAQMLTVVACPYSVDSTGAHKYFMSSGISAPSNASCTNCMTMANTLAVAGPGYPNPRNTNFVMGTCTPVKVLGLAGGQAAQFPPATTLSFLVDNAVASTGVILYNNQNCAGGQIALNTPVNVGGSEFDFFIMAQDNAAHTLAVTSSGGLAAPLLPVSGVGTPSPLVPVLAVQAPSSIVAYTCYPFSMQSWNDYGNADQVIYPGPNGANFQLPTGGFQFYSGGGCNSFQITNSTMTTNQTAFTGSFMYTGAATSVNIVPTSSNFTGGTIVGTPNITVSQPGAPVKLAVSGVANSMNVGNSYQFQVQLVDANGNPAPAPAAGVALDGFNSTGNSGIFYQSVGGSCSSTPIGTQTLAQGTTNLPVCFTATAAMPNVTLTVSSSTSNMTASQSNITISPAVANQIVAFWPGQSALFNVNYYSFNPTYPPIFVGTNPSTVVLKATRYDGSVDPNFTFSIPMTGSFMPANFTANFVAGVATVQLQAGMTGFLSFNFASGTFMYSGTNIGITNAFANVTLPNLTIYMNNSSDLLVGGCQPLMIAAEASIGAVIPAAANTVTYSSSLGNLYTNPACTVPATGTGSVGPGAPDIVLFYKVTSGSTIINVSSANFNPGTLTTHYSAGSVGAATHWQALGNLNMSTYVGHCEPFIAYLADSAGNFVDPGANITNLQVFNAPAGAGMVYASTDSSCLAAPLSGMQTLTTSQGYFQFNAAAPTLSGATEELNVMDGTSTYTPQASGSITAY
jgi:hypothetical protein